MGARVFISKQPPSPIEKSIDVTLAEMFTGEVIWKSFAHLMLSHICWLPPSFLDSLPEATDDRREQTKNWIKSLCWEHLRFDLWNIYRQMKSSIHYGGMMLLTEFLSFASGRLLMARRESMGALFFTERKNYGNIMSSYGTKTKGPWMN